MLQGLLSEECGYEQCGVVFCVYDFVCMKNCSLFKSRWDRIQLKLEEVCVNMGKSEDTEKRCEKLIGIIENERRNHSYSKFWRGGMSCSLEISIFVKYISPVGVTCLLKSK